jgi:hypothetical protein
LRTEVARVEVDLLQDLAGHHRGQPTEVVDERHVRAVDEHARVARRRAAHDQQAIEGSGAGHAGHVADRAQRVAVGARHFADFFARDAVLGRLARRALAFDRDVERVDRCGRRRRGGGKRLGGCGRGLFRALFRGRFELEAERDLGGNRRARSGRRLEA